MLGTRKVYSGSAINASCILSLENVSPGARGRTEVLLAAIGDTIEVFDIAPCRRERHGSRSPHAPVFSFTPRGHAFLVGAPVLAIVPLPYQLILVWTRTLEVVLVRYQANLPPPSEHMSDVHRAGGAGLWMPSWVHWCLCDRIGFAPVPPGAKRGTTPLQPLERPSFTVSGGPGEPIIIAAFVFPSLVLDLKLAWAGGVQPPRECCDCCWTQRRRATIGPLNQPDPQSSSSEMYLLPHPEPNSRDERGLRSVTADIAPSSDNLLAEPFYDLIDEDLLPVLCVRELMERKSKLAQACEEDEERTMQQKGSAEAEAVWELPLMSTRLLSGGRPWPLPRRGGSGNGSGASVADFYRVNSVNCCRVRRFAIDNVSGFALNAFRSHVRPYRMQCYRNIGGTYSVVVHITEAGANGEAVEKIIHLREWESVMAEPFSFEGIGQAEQEYRPGREPTLGDSSVVEALSVLCPPARRGGPPSIEFWLLLASGALVTMAYLPEGTDRSTLPWASADAPSTPLETRPATIIGLPLSFRISRFLPVGAKTLLDYQINTTDRYAIVTDDISDVYLVDLHHRRVVGGLVGDGAMASVCAGPVGTRDLFVAHTKGVVRRLAPTVLLKPYWYGNIVRTPSDGARSAAVGSPRLLVPVLHGSRRDVPFPQGILVTDGSGYDTIVHVDTASLTLAGAPLCTAEAEREEGRPRLVCCTALAVYVLSCSPCGQQVIRVGEAVALPCSATHAAATVCPEEGVVFVVAVLSDGRLCLVEHSSAAAWGPALQVTFVSEWPVVGGALSGPAAACGLARLPSRVAGGEGTRGCLVVPVGCWGDGIRMCYLQPVPSPAAAAQRQWSLRVAKVHLSNPEGTYPNTRGHLYGCPVEPPPTPRQIVPAPAVGSCAVFAIRSSSGSVTVLSVAAPLREDAGVEAEAALPLAEWTSLLYTARLTPIGASDERVNPTATAIGAVSVINTSTDTSQREPAPTLGGGRSCVLLLQGKVVSLLFFSVLRLDQADTAGVGDERESGMGCKILVATEEQLQMSVEAHINCDEWEMGCGVVDVCATGSLAHASVKLLLVGREYRSTMFVFVAVEPSSSMFFQKKAEFNPELQSVAESQASNARRCGYHVLDMEMVVRTPPHYQATAVRHILQDALTEVPGAYLSHAAYCPISNTLVTVVNRVAMPYACPSELVAVDGDSLHVVGRMVVPDREVLCMQTIPSSPSTRFTDDVAPQDLVLIGTRGVAHVAEAALLLVLPQPLRVVLTVPLSSAPYDGVTDVAVHVSRGRAWRPTAREEEVAQGEEASGRREEEEDEGDEVEIMVAACCGKVVHLLRLTGLTLIPIATHSSNVYCFTVSLTLPYVAVGCGTGGSLWLRLQGDHKSTSRAAQDGSSEDTSATAAAAAVAAAPGEVSAPPPPLHGYPQQPMRLCPVVFVPSMNVPTTAQTSYRGSQVVQTDSDGGVCWMGVDLGSSRPPAPSASDATWLAGTNEAACHVHQYACVRLPSAPTTVTTVTAIGASSDGHAALWRRRRRCHRHGDQSRTLRNTSNVRSGCGPLVVLLPCQDGSLYTIQETPLSFTVDLTRLEQAYTDRLAAFLAPARPIGRYDNGRPKNLYPVLDGRVGDTTVVPVPLVYYGVPYSTSVALRNCHRTLAKQGVMSVDTLEQIFRLKEGLCGVQAPRTVQDRPYCITAEMERLLWELHGTDVTLEDCQETCAAW